MHRSMRVFRALLALYPTDFRDEYGREMTLVFSDRYRHATGRIERASIWVEAIVGVLIEAPKEHWRMFLQDLRYALRALRKNPLFAMTVVAALALGIGSNSAVFSVLNAVVLRTLPIPNPERLYVLREEAPPRPFLRSSWPLFERLQQGMPSSGTIAAMSRVARMHARAGGAAESEPVGVQLVSGRYFATLGLSAAQGRLLTDEDNRTLGSHPVAVISEGCWRRRFGGSSDVVGQEISLNRARFTIVGVAPEGFSGVWLESPVDVWVPIAMQQEVRYSQNYSASDADTGKPWMPQERISWLDVLVRMPAGTESAITAALNTQFQQMLAQRAEAIGDAEQRRRFLQRRLAPESFPHGISPLRARFTTPLYALMGMAALVLLIACANTANLLLARATGRSREIALRLSLGAGRVRLVQQLLTESLVLVSIAAVIALIIARWTADVLVRMATSTTSGPAPFTADIDPVVLAFTAAVALATAVLFGLVPAVRTTRVDLAGSLKTGAATISGGSGTKMPRVLVVLQVALSLVLLVGTGLLVRSLQNVLRIDLGFAREHLLSVAIDPRLAGYSPQQLPALYSRLLDRLGSVPGVESTAIAMCGILVGCRSAEDGLSIEGYQSRPGEQVLVVNNIVSPGYFETVGMRLVAGRLLNERDSQGAQKVVVVNEAFVRRYFGDGQPLGKKFGYKTLDQEIVGVVEDARVLNVKERPDPTAFFLFDQRRVVPHHLEIRTSGDPRQIANAVRQAIVEVEPNLPVEGVMTLSERVRTNLSQERLLLSLTSAFGALALGLAGFGLFGLLSYAVARRTADLGIRLALGASRGSVLWAVLRESLLLAFAGIAVGLPLVMAGARVMSGLLFGVKPHDAATIVTAVGVLVVVAAVSGLLPAWRASRVDPLSALRFE